MSPQQQRLDNLFAKAVCMKATEPIKQGATIAVTLAEEGPFSLIKSRDRMVVSPAPPLTPDLSFLIPLPALSVLEKVESSSVGDVGIEILKLMVHGDPEYRIQAKVHLGLFSLLRHGYLSVLTLGGPAVMKFLASKGLTNMGKIKDAIARMKT